MTHHNVLHVFINCIWHHVGPESVSSVYNVEPSYILYSTFTAQTTSRRVVQKQIPHVWQGTECYLSEYVL